MYRWLALLIILCALGAVPLWWSGAPYGLAAGTDRCRRLLRLACWPTLLGGAGVAFTGFVAAIVLGEPLDGWLLLLHTAAAGLFVFGLTACVWLGAGAAVQAVAQGRGWRTLPFWLLGWSSVMAALSALLMMTPLFGTPGQHWLYLIHRTAALGVVVGGLWWWASRPAAPALGQP